MKRILSIYLLVILTIVVSFYSIKSISAKFEQGYTTEDDVVDYNFDLEFAINSYSDEDSSNTVEEYEVVNVRAKSYVIFNVDVENANSSIMYYGIWYKILDDVYNDLDVGKYVSYANDTLGSLNSGEVKTTTIVIRNNENVNVSVKIGVASSSNSIDDIGYYDGRKLVEGIISDALDNDVNEPILSGYMIPVYYDSDSHLWKKADYKNKDGNWYNYEDKRWANIVLVKEDMRDNYLKASINSIINMSDVLAFYVWVPRFKYMVWDINRETNNMDDYSYDANKYGIKINFEKDGNSTGNVSCNYNYSSTLGLFDECMYVSNAVSMNTGNSVYADSWYTHPAFIRGDKKISGFWFSKFETTGDKENPTILPNSKALTDISLADMFNTSKKIQNYGIGSMDVSMARNVEWAAVAYLSHSIYGMCENDICSDIYRNNSIELYTGRSSGTYYDEGFNQFGTYSYDGYDVIDGVIGTNYNSGIISSTTGNVSGIYDMVGGALEYVMGNISDESFKINVGANSGNWEGINLDNSNVDLYSLFNSVNDGYYKSKLGDATSEVSIDGYTWGNTIKTEIKENGIWMVRGIGNNIYGYEYASGSGEHNYSFRSVIY